MTVARSAPSHHERQQRHARQQHRELAELDADVEGQQRRDEVRTGELQRFGKREREAEAVHEAEREGQHPALVRRGAEDVEQRHRDDRRGDGPLDERRKPQPLRRDAERRGAERQRMRQRERGGNDDERPQPPKRDRQARDEEQVVSAIENVREAFTHEAPRGLVPARIERDEAGVAVPLEGALGALGPCGPCSRQEAQRRDDPQAHARQSRLERERPGAGADRVAEQHVEVLRLPGKSVCSGIGGARRCAIACSQVANERSEASDTRAASTCARGSAWPSSKTVRLSANHSSAAVRSAESARARSR
ncbi:MAG: hypothetical protein U1F67_25805 [Rubrivivax sp.]